MFNPDFYFICLLGKMRVYYYNKFRLLQSILCESNHIKGHLMFGQQFLLYNAHARQHVMQCSHLWPGAYKTQLGALGLLLWFTSKRRRSQSQECAGVGDGEDTLHWGSLV